MAVSRPSLYHYIKSKDELLERLAEDLTAAALTVASEVGQNGQLTAPQKLHLAMRRMIEFIAAKPSRFRHCATGAGARDARTPSSPPSAPERT
jgi:AcrR family transcriptional regulator